MNQEEALLFAREALLVEAEAIRRLADRLDGRFVRALELLDGCRGKVVVTGVGKSGLAGRKLAATLTSTGCPAVFLHPSEAMHGDLGIVAPEDVVIALSNSGESEELLAILPSLLARGVAIISLVGNMVSTLAMRSAVALDAGVEREVCPLNLAPTTSVVAAMALGDALAMALQSKRNLTPEEYAVNHPGGRLGRRLTLRVQDVMPDLSGRTPQVRPESTFHEVVCELTAGHMGAVCVMDGSGKLAGLIAEADFRNAFLKHEAASFGLTAADIMNPAPALALHPEQLAYEALQLLTDRPRPLSVAPVIDDQGGCIGLIRVNDLVKAGL